jgi:hypothetical protein
MSGNNNYSVSEDFEKFPVLKNIFNSIARKRSDAGLLPLII